MTPSFRLIAVLPAILVACLSQPLAAADNDLARAYRVIASKRFVDLTHSFDPRSPVWSGFGQAKMTPAADPKTQRPYTIKEDGFRTTLYEFVGQYGTHVDPPAHFDEKGITMDAIPLKQMILPLVVLDATPYLQKDPNHAFSVADLHAGRKSTGASRVDPSWRCEPTCTRTGTPTPSDSSALRFRPGHSRRSSFCMSSAASWRQDTKSLDTDTTDKMESETYILQHGHYQIEVMANLDKVPPKGALIVVTWPKVRNGLGFPARAFAILP